MPMTWNAEADAKLFAAVIQVTDLKLSQDTLKQIAEIMGEDCTPKALTHRIAKFKTLAKNGSGDGADGAKAPAKKAAAPKAKGKAGKKADTPVEGDDEEIEVKPKKAGGKRKKAEPAEDEESKHKKVKSEEDDAGDEF